MMADMVVTVTGNPLDRSVTLTIMSVVRNGDTATGECKVMVRT